MHKIAIAVATIALAIVPALPASAMVIPTNRVPPPTTVPGGNNTPESSAATCGSELGVLPRVHAEQVAGVNDEKKVWVTVMCDDIGMLRSEGNAAYLEPVIAQNDVLVDVLRHRSYFPEDVFAVKMVGSDTIHLYIHRF